MYQGGASVELLRAAGKDPARTYGAKLKGAVRRTYDAETRGYVWCVEGGASTRLALGDASSHTSIKGGLGLHLRYVALQVKLPPGRSQFAAELSIVDQSGRRRRLLLSSSFGSITSSTLHAQLPLAADLLPRGTWCTLTLDCVALAQQAWGDCFRALDGLSIAPQCKLRCIVALRDGEVRPKCITLPKSVPMETVHIPGAVQQPTPSKAPSPLDIVGTGLRKKPNLALASRAPALPRPKTPLPSPPLPPPPATLPTPMPPRTPIEFFNEGVRRSGRAPPTRSTRCSRDVGFVEPGHATRRSRKAPKRPPTPAAPHMDEAPPSYDASVYASSVLKSADFKLPPAEDEPPPSARASVDASFDASEFALPPRPTTAAAAKASFDAAAYAEEAYAAARAPPAASFDDAEPAEAPAAAACEPTAAASLDGAEDELPVEASFEAADYELPPSARASVEASLDAAASAAASFDASKFVLPRGDAPPAVETIRLTPAHASPRSSVASDYDASASGPARVRGAPRRADGQRADDVLLPQRQGRRRGAGAGAGADAARRAALGRRARLAQVDPRGRRRLAGPAGRDALPLRLARQRQRPGAVRGVGALRRAVVGDDAAARGAGAAALGAPRAHERERRVAADADECRVPRLPERRVPRARRVDAARLRRERRVRRGAAVVTPRIRSERWGAAVVAAELRHESQVHPARLGRPAGRPRTGAPPTVDESCVGFPFADAAAPAPAAAAPSVASPAARAATPVLLRSAEAAPAATPAAATPVVAEPTPPELAPLPSASPSASVERAATPGDVNAAVLAEIARLRAENAELRAANERLSPAAAPAPPPVQASLDDPAAAAPGRGAGGGRRGAAVGPRVDGDVLRRPRLRAADRAGRRRLVRRLRAAALRAGVGRGVVRGPGVRAAALHAGVRGGGLVRRRGLRPAAAGVRRARGAGAVQRRRRRPTRLMPPRTRALVGRRRRGRRWSPSWSSTSRTPTCAAGGRAVAGRGARRPRSGTSSPARRRRRRSCRTSLSPPTRRRRRSARSGRRPRRPRPS